jgi:hypothetical protein
MNDQTSRKFAASLINAVKNSTNHLSALSDGSPRDLSFDQAIAVSQVTALNAIAASLLAVADAIENANGAS